MSDSENKRNKNYLLNSPKKCNYYKKILLEELALMPDLLDLHYGDCAVIGKIRKEPTGEIYLENIRTTYLPKKYRLAEGLIAIKVFDVFFNEYLPSGKTVEIFGKVILYDKTNIENNLIPSTTKDLCFKFLNFLKMETENDLKKNIEIFKVKFNKILKNIYEPAIQIRYVNILDSANEIIENNLQIRIMCNK